MSLSNVNKIKYIKLTAMFLFLIFILAAVNALLRKLGYSFPGLQNSMLIILFIILGLFGWLLRRRYNSSIIRIFFLGMILSLGSHWTLPLFHKGKEIIQLIIINSAIFAFVTFLGGILSIVMKSILNHKEGIDE